ncbi:DNA-deoxyinosine glycosylase [Clostridium aminobutyricum]|uniref:DNA-deoxyinosine glycosylase n=2 Tax=Clostridium aminobutyricum TaxID=33953 RepID=A0A939D8K0_CLOAM|nr:DNA-deoxyinosine glycosylase [Clostridium aminobutyricum]MBN7773100.1 DNA-deoxyinosine glycosylase [Clostridium aminobutyricum]
MQPFEPVYNKNSRILILGSLPSVKSRENGFYYGHPQNRFWRMLAGVYEAEIPQTVSQKKEFLYQCNIALWDVIESCEIKGSSDSSIREVVVADIHAVLGQAPIERIFANGKTAQRLYNKYAKEKTGREIIELPSTSPANAAYSLEKLIQKWAIIRG